MLHPQTVTYCAKWLYTNHQESTEGIPSESNSSRIFQIKTETKAIVVIVNAVFVGIDVDSSIPDPHLGRKPFITKTHGPFFVRPRREQVHNSKACGCVGVLKSRMEDRDRVCVMTVNNPRESHNVGDLKTQMLGFSTAELV